MGLFKNIEEVENAGEALVQFANEAVYGQAFALSFPVCDSKLRSGDVSEPQRLDELAQVIEPYLQELVQESGWSPSANPLRQHAFEETISHKLDQIREHGLSNDSEDWFMNFAAYGRQAFLVIGMFVGARMADASGQALENLKKVWIETVLRADAYEDLKATRSRRRATKKRSGHEHLAHLKRREKSRVAKK